MERPKPVVRKKRRLKFLQDVPSEIRNLIYRYSLVFESKISGNTKVPTAALLRTSRQIHSEASSIFYGENTFTFHMELDWTNRAEIQLHNFPPRSRTGGIPIWPTPRYHRYLSKLHVRVSFRAGAPEMLEPPPIYPLQLKSFRLSFATCWDQLQLTWEFVHLPIFTFTSAWIKLSVFSHAEKSDARIDLADDILDPCGVLSWILSVVLKGSDPQVSLSPAQSEILGESLKATSDLYTANCRNHVALDLARRVMSGDHAYSNQRFRSQPRNGLIMGGPDTETERKKAMSDAEYHARNLQHPAGGVFQFGVNNIFAPHPTLVPAANAVTDASTTRAAMEVANFKRNLYNFQSFVACSSAIRDKYGDAHIDDAISLLTRDSMMRVCAYYLFREQGSWIRQELLSDRDIGEMNARMCCEISDRLEDMRGGYR